jgi:serine/threonine-protein kinase SRPK3
MSSSSYCSGQSDPDSDIDWTGVILNNKYLCIKLLGYGACASVWTVFNIDNKSFYAVKIHNRNDYSYGESEALLLNKIKSFKSKYVINIVETFIHENEIDNDSQLESDSVSGSETENEHYCIVMELMACSLYDLIRKGKYTNGLPYEFVKKTIYHTLLGLKVLQTNGYIHTDVKPENLLLNGESQFMNKLSTVFKSKTFDDTIKKKKLELHKKTKGNAKNKLKEKNINITHMAYSLVVKDILKEISNISDSNNSSRNSSSTRSSNSSSTYTDNGTQYRYIRHDFLSESELNLNSELDLDLDSDSDSDSDLNIDNTCIVADSTLMEPIKLADMGTCIEHKNNNTCFSIQTRYYRSPEVLLNIPYTYNCDIWSVGCTIYELLTGDLLFDDRKKPSFLSDDRYHIYEMQKRLGEFPHSFINKSKIKDLFFKNNNILKTKQKILFEPLWILLSNKIKNIPLDESDNLTSLLMHMLEYDFTNRYSIDDCLNHPWFANVAK